MKMEQHSASATVRLADTENKYDDIINLPHYTSRFRKRMSMTSRAAQFAPFAALAGFEKAIEETGQRHVC